MRTLYFLVPGTSRKFACGGLWAELKTMHLAQRICPAEVVTYRQREKDRLYLDDLLQKPSLEDSIFVISWGFDVPKLARRLQPYNVVYHAHSAGYGFQLPSRIPIIAVSRNTMAYWGQQSPNAPIYYLPNQISDEFSNLQRDRDIDVLVQTRKSSQYLLYQLIPALQQHCHVVVLDSYVEDLAGLFNRAKVYLYDSAEYWALQNVSEGFGLPPMEALACGCQIFSSLNGALSDYLDPGLNCHKIAVYSTEYDVQRILNVVRSESSVSLPEQFFSEYRTQQILQKLTLILKDINTFFDHKNRHSPDILPLTTTRRIKLQMQRILSKVKQKLSGSTRK
jgi:glycosyltransferase involved in cell wall biosynthesis